MSPFDALPQWKESRASSFEKLTITETEIQNQYDTALVEILCLMLVM